MARFTSPGPRCYTKAMIYLGADHGGFRLKERLKQVLARTRRPFVDLGSFKYDAADDYPLIAARVARAVQRHPGSRGLLLCRSGVGVSIVANRYRRIRCVLASEAWGAARARRDEDANVLALPSERLSTNEAISIMNVWFRTTFRNAARDRRRLREIDRAPR